MTEDKKSDDCICLASFALSDEDFIQPTHYTEGVYKNGAVTWEVTNGGGDGRGKN